MSDEDMAARLERAEIEISVLRERLDTAQGEATFAGLLVAPLMTVLIRKGLLPGEVARDMLDRLQLRFEEAEGTFPGSRGAFEHARARVEATLRPLLGDLGSRS